MVNVIVYTPQCTKIDRLTDEMSSNKKKIGRFLLNKSIGKKS